MNRMRRDPLQGKEVLITAGQWKGHRGKVCKIDDRQAMVEISSVCKKIAIDRCNIQDIKESERDPNPEYQDPSRTMYDGGKTPMQFNTPSYYPHSPHGWGAATPAVGTDCKLFKTLTFRRWCDVSRNVACGQRVSP